MITLEHICKSYASGATTVHALKDISLTINDGEYIAITGPSGGGKSTLMNVLGCLDVPSSGEYVLNGRHVGRLNDDQLAAVVPDHRGRGGRLPGEPDTGDGASGAGL